jgi:hypothetical protein
MNTILILSSILVLLCVLYYIKLQKENFEEENTTTTNVVNTIATTTSNPIDSTTPLENTNNNTITPSPLNNSNFDVNAYFKNLGITLPQTTNNSNFDINAYFKNLGITLPQTTNNSNFDINAYLKNLGITLPQTTNNANSNVNNANSNVNNANSNRNDLKGKCVFKPRGQDINTCLDLCQNTDECTHTNCYNHCMDCNDTDCEWVKRKLVPSKTILYTEPDIESVIFKWSAPYSKYNLTNYSLVIQEKNNTDTKMIYYPKTLKSSINSYKVSELQPSKTYEAYLISSNIMGNSEPSNTVHFKPKSVTIQKSETSPRQAFSINGYDDNEYEKILDLLTKKKETENNRKVFKFNAHIL